MASPFGPKATATAAADDLLMITRGTGASLEVEKIDPRAAATGALIALGLDATLGSTAWRTGGGGGGGFSILNGASDPVGGTGSDGDFFINTSSWTIFGPKASGSWPSSVSLVGPTGAVGAPGGAGADGTDGADGATILTGIRRALRRHR